MMESSRHGWTRWCRFQLKPYLPAFFWSDQDLFLKGSPSSANRRYLPTGITISAHAQRHDILLSYRKLDHVLL